MAENTDRTANMQTIKEYAGKGQNQHARICRFCGRPVGIMRNFFADARSFWCPTCWIEGPKTADGKPAPDPRSGKLF